MVTWTVLETGPRNSRITSFCERVAVRSPSTVTTLVADPDAGRLGGAAGNDFGDAIGIGVVLEQNADAAKAVACGALVARDLRRSVARETIEPGSDAVKHRFIDFVLGIMRELWRCALGVVLNLTQPPAPSMRIVV